MRHLGAFVPPLTQALLAIHDEQDSKTAFCAARRKIGSGINSQQYSRSYEAILNLHLLHDVEMVHQADRSIVNTKTSANSKVIQQQIARTLIKSLDDRFTTTSPSFRIREAVLTNRRTAYSLASATLLQTQIGHAWIQSSKIARKAGYDQTAYSATLQAKEVNAPYAFIQQAKLLHARGGAFKALTDLENAVMPLLEDSVVDFTDEEFAKDRNLAKVCARP